MSVPNDEIDRVLRATPVFQKLTAEDRRKVAEVAAVRHYKKGQIIFEQGTPSDAFYTIASGRVKIFRMLPTGKDVILEVFGAGDPVGALAAYDGRPFPASAATLEDTACVVIPRGVFFRLLEEHPSLVRGLMLGLTHRLVELTNRVTELSGARIEPRFARLFLKLAGEKARERRGGTLVPLPLSRRELADMTGHRDRDPDHEPLGQAGHRPHREGWFRCARSRGARVGRCRVVANEVSCRQHSPHSVNAYKRRAPPGQRL